MTSGHRAQDTGTDGQTPEFPNSERVTQLEQENGLLLQQVRKLENELELN